MSKTTNKPDQPRLSSEDPVEGRRDVPSNKTQNDKRQYDVDKVPKKEYSSEDPTEETRPHPLKNKHP